MRPPAAPRTYAITRAAFQRALASVYALAFACALEQFVPLAGERGLLPVERFVRHARFWDAPSLFFWNASDAFAYALAASGLALALFALSGASERFGSAVSAAAWGLLWLFYLSFVNVGQIWYGFGWETMLLEAGFLSIFLGARDVRAPARVIWMLRWLLFRLMFGAGLIKLRGDAAWRDLTALFHHYETQPLPNPLSPLFHHAPEAFLKFQVLYTHFVELVVPWFYFLGGWPAWLAGAFTVHFQGCLILSGNLSWLNYLSIAIAISCFDDAFWTRLLRRPPPPVLAAPSRPRRAALAALTALVAALSVFPALNLLSPRQRMNASFEPLRLVNTYGAFGTVTRERNELVFEGSADGKEWKEYGFRAKPGDPMRRPAVVAPYHLRLDWLLWFAAMDDWRAHPWTLNLVYKMLRGDTRFLRLLAHDPFEGAPPRYVRVLVYRYRFTASEEKRRTGAWWARERRGVYLPPLSLENAEFMRLVRELGWEDRSPKGA